MTDRNEIRAALAFIPADDRDLWVRVGMAIHSEFPGDEGFDLFDAWSQAGEGYNAHDVRDVWHSFKPGRVTLGTLWHEAKARGFKGKAPAAPVTEAERKRLADERLRRRALDEAQYRTRADEAARDAQRLWDEARDQGRSPYLERKGVCGHGVRYLADGTLLVPVRNAAGELQNLQRIAPTKPSAKEEASGKREKRFMPGGRKSGLWHMLGEPAGAEVIAIAEGYATAASVHEACGRPVAVAFDAGNLAKVAQALRAAYPAARLLIAGDDDRDTEARTGKNPGREKATAAARGVHGLAVFPAGLPEGASDFNDLARHVGIDVVRQAIEQAAAELVAGAVQASARKPRKRAEQSGQDARAHVAEGASGSHGAEAASAPPDGTAGLFDRFALTEGGVFFTETDQDGRARSPLWVCSRLAVVAHTHDADGDGWGYLLEFENQIGKQRTWAMPARLLAGDGAEYRAVLLGLGVRTASGTKARNLLTQYLQTRQPEQVATCTDRLGWHGRAFVLPRETLQRATAADEDAAERIVYQADGPTENPFRVRGTLDAWRSNVAALCTGNSRLLFTVSCAFAGPLMRPGGLDSGGFHLRGSTSCGKTTALCAAASVWGAVSGESKYMQTWRATDNALETVAAKHCDGLLILDELAQVDPRTAGECSYMLANETSKARSTRTGQARSRLTWRLLFLSAGEIGLAAHMAEGGKRARAGQELRMVDIPAEVAPGSIFEATHGFDGGAAFAEWLPKACEAQHGAVGRAWLAWLVDEVDTLRDRVREAVDQITAQWVRGNASGQVHRVGRRFALVAVAGELATEAGLTGWQRGAATAAAKACLDAWIAHRPGGLGNAEEAQMLAQVRRWLQLNGAGRFTWWHRALDDRAPDKGMRAGYRRMLTKEGQAIDKNEDHMREFGERIGEADAADATVEYFVFPEVFKTEACEGFDAQTVLRLLRDRGYLKPDKGRPFDCKPRLPGLGPTRCYRIEPAIFEGDED